MTCKISKYHSVCVFLCNNCLSGFGVIFFVYALYCYPLQLSLSFNHNTFYLICVLSFQATVLCDVVVLYVLQKKYFYREKKYLFVDDDDSDSHSGDYEVI